MKIYTRGGDEGDTGLLGGARVSKTDPRVEAYGTVDELNSSLGLALALDEGGVLGRDADPLREVQGDLLTLGAALASARPDRERDRGTIPTLPEGRVAEIEAWIDRLAEELPALDAFLLAGGCPAGAQLHVARTVCRRAERAAVRLAGQASQDSRTVVSATLPYLNRLSDLLFMLARAANRRAGTPEVEWTPVRRRGAAGGEAAGS
jgi:cob(I)alamin adenosyltransferase